MHMEETAQQTQQPPSQKKDNSVIFYILGGLIITAVIVVGFLVYPKQSTTPETTAETGQPVLGEQTQQAAAEETAKPNTPIGSLACTSQFYNTVNGVPGTYYISTEGEVPTAGGQVTCTVIASVNNQDVQRVEVSPTLVSVPERGGSTFKCTTQGVRLTPNTPTKITTELKDANGVTASCNRTFLFP